MLQAETSCIAKKNLIALECYKMKYSVLQKKFYKVKLSISSKMYYINTACSSTCAPPMKRRTAKTANEPDIN
ncbi:MAG: hypothetical protein N5P05_004292 (plasmid) [Chroococcopsis gigantea SAG 12.99]|nr:hypothetical protein [Chroococcopsis gigantea SAG 12.99]